MSRLLVFLHVGLVITALLPVYRPNYFNYPLLRLPWRESYPETWCDLLPLEEIWKALERKQFSLYSVIAAGVPALLALLNLPLFRWLRGEFGDRWRAYSSLTFGLVSTSGMSQLLARYGYGRDWGAWVIWGLSLGLMIAGLVAVSRLKTSGTPLPVIQDSTT